MLFYEFLKYELCNQPSPTSILLFLIFFSAAQPKHKPKEDYNFMRMQRKLEEKKKQTKPTNRIKKAMPIYAMIHMVDP